MISHIVFAEYSLIFCRATQENADYVKNILQLYQSLQV